MLDGKIDIKKMIANQRQSMPFNDGDYEQDGVYYCGVCKTPKETMHETLGAIRQLCDCKKKREDERELTQKHTKFENRLAHFMEGLDHDPVSKEWNFTNDDSPQSIPSLRLKKYVDNWDKVVNNNIGLILEGDVGTGKTFYGHCVVNALLHKFIFAYVLNLPNFIIKLQGSGFEADKLIKKVQAFDLLVLDDFGATRTTDYAIECIYNIVDGRYRKRKPTIITTNLSLGDFMKKDVDITTRRIHDRIMEICVASIHVDASPRRVKKALEKKKMTNEILGI